MNNDLELLKAMFLELYEGQRGVEEFCRCFENIWNFEVEKSNLTDDLRLRLDDLFDQVVLFSPFPREEWGYAGYRDESEIRRAAEPAMKILGVSK